MLSTYLRKMISFLIPLVLLGVLAFLVLFVLKGLVDLGISDSAVGFLAVASSAAVTLRSLDTQVKLERARQLNERRDRLAESCREVYDLVLQGKTPSESTMRSFNVDLTFFGDEPLIKAWLDMRRVAGRSDRSASEMLPAQMRMLRAMRVTLGHNDKSLSDADLWGIVLKDPDEEPPWPQ